MGHCAAFPAAAPAARAFWTAASENGSASRLTTVRAPRGHSPMHAPRPSHRASATSLALPPWIRIAPSAQDGTQAPQPSQRSSSMTMICRRSAIFSP